jgi:hypothetical protein
LGAALVIGKAGLSWQRFEGQWLGEKDRGHLQFYFIGLVKRSCPWIVAHIPRNLEGGEVFLIDSPSGRLEFKVESYSVNWLGWIAVGVLVGCDTV